MNLGIAADAHGRSLEHRVVILLMRPDPRPKKGLFVLEMTYGAVMRSDANRPHAAVERFEMKRWIAKISEPQPIGLIGQQLHIPRERGIKLPEFRMNDGLHEAAILRIFRPDSPDARFP